MNALYRLRVCTILLLAVTASTAQPFSGQVVDKETGTGVPGVSVSILNPTEKTTTDSDGKFTLTPQAVTQGCRFRSVKNTIVTWHSSTRMLDLTMAPRITRVHVYSMRGECLFSAERSPNSGLMQLPVVTTNVYLLRFAAGSRESFTTAWMHSGRSDVSIPLTGHTPDYPSGQATIINKLVFQKTDYQTDTVDIDSDSTYTAMLVKMKPVIGSRVFDEDTVRTYKLYLTDDNLARLLDFTTLVTNTYTVNPVYVPARLDMEGRKLDSIAVRFRGDQSIWDCIENGKRKIGLKYPQYGFGNCDICAKFSMKFDFNKYNRDNRLYGLKALNFRSMSADPTKMHEKLGFSLFADMGIPCPRIAYARLYVNDSLWGLFDIAEEIDGRFTKSHYPANGDGNLYKEIWPTSQLTQSKIKDALTTNNDPEDNPDISDFKDLRDVVTASETDSAAFLQKIGQVVDIPHLVRYIVVDRAIMNFDGIMACYGGELRHNYCWYHDETSGLFQLIPWDLDKVFIYPEPNFWTNNEPVGKNIVPNWNVVNSSYTAIRCYYDQGSGNTQGYTVIPIDNDTFLRRLRSATWNDFHTQGEAFLDTVFTREKIDARLGKWRTCIAGAVGEDPTIDSTEWSTMVDSLSHSIPLFRTNLKMMIDTLIVQ